MMVYTTEKFFIQKKMFFIHPLWIMANLSIKYLLINAKPVCFFDVDIRVNS